MEKKYSLYNLTFGWLAFIGASIVYLLTMEPTVSLWDCGEFIATAAKLEVGHPPGAPLFLMLGRFFALFAGDDVTLIAACINALSAIASGATIMFLFWTITHLAKKVFAKNNLTGDNMIAIIGSGLIGAGAYTFSDTFWFSAVEGEVYALSSLFTAVVFWAILKWENVAHKPNADKWVILIAYIMGLSIGVHLLNLLTITAIVYVYYFKKFKPSPKGVILSGILSVVLIAFMMWGVIVGSVEVAAQFELFFVNSLGLPFQSGLISYLVLLFGLIIYAVIITKKSDNIVQKTTVVSAICLLVGLPFISSNILLIILILGALVAGIYYMGKKNKYILNTIVNAIAVIMIGYSSYAMIIIRSHAETPMNENAPKNAFALLSYLNREQYGDTPLFHGQYYNALLDRDEDGRARMDNKYTYTPRGDKYVKVDNGVKYKWKKEFTTIFPRMHSSEDHHVEVYKEWGGVIESGPNKNTTSFDYIDGETYEIPSFTSNLRFFFTYQVGHMYGRYFMWNFAGRQSDVQSHGGVTEGNWITGIDAVDNILIGDQSEISDKSKNDVTRNTYYLLPFLLGLIGFLFHISKAQKDSFVVFLLFILTGLAIVVFLNQNPYQPRERDYAYAGSFYAFCIWIGLSLLGIYYYAKKYLKNGHIAAALAILITVPTPIVLATENWDDHDRSGRYTALEFARNYLETCDPNAIIITAGDNDTFPLWYAQEVEGIRTDVRVVCTPLLSTDWYSQQMMRRTYESAPLPTKLKPEQVAKGIRDLVIVKENHITQGKYIELSQAMEVVREDDMMAIYYDDSFNYIPASKLKFKVDKEKVYANNIVSRKDSAYVVDSIKFHIKGNTVYKNKLIIYDILDGYQWDRPIYFTNPMSAQELGLQNYIRFDGFAYKFVPIYSEEPRAPYTDTDVMYDNLMNKYKWGGMGDSTVHMNHFNQRTVRVINVRSMFSSLALQLAEEGKNEKAKEVLARLKQILPDSQFPYDDDNVITTAYAYYSVEDFAGGNAELLIYANNLIDELEWHASLESEYLDVYRELEKQYSSGGYTDDELAIIRKKLGATDFDKIRQEQYIYKQSMIRIGEVVLREGQKEFFEKLEFEWVRVGSGATLMQTIEQKREEDRQRYMEQQRIMQQQQQQKLQQQAQPQQAAPISLQ
jgi:hypothetical protein